MKKSDFKYAGTYAMTVLHDQHMRSFLKTWQKANSANITLPETEDTAYVSMEALLRHILSAGRGYMVWMCKQLELPDSQINQVPELEVIESESETYLEHLLEKWKIPLRQLDEEHANIRTYKTNWGVDYCIDAMLEHAVMHPIRHEFQLIELMNK